MKCIKCNKDSNKQDRVRNSGRCPSCQHPFVTEPTEDGITDMQIKIAQNEASANGTLYFSKAQLKYQLRRKLEKKLKVYKVAALVAALVFFIFLLFALIKGGVAVVVLSVLSGFIFILTLGTRFKYSNSINRLDFIMRKWVTINPHEKLLTDDKYQDNKSSTRNLDGISFERVLVCERNDTVDFFLSNLFHFHYSCPVLGGNGYPQGIYEDMLTRLKQNPNLKVFLLHDYTPTGYAFVRRMKTDSNWFASLPPSNIIDLGLNVGQKKLFKSMTIKKTDRNQKISENAELSLFQPAVLVAMCGAAINEGVPFDLISSASAADHSNGYG
jgi:hypothetical protein